MDQKMSTQEFEIIYERYKTTLYRVAFTYLKNNHDVLDVLQEVFMKRFYKASHFENEDQEKYWMIRITINLSKNHLNSFWHKNVGTIDEISESPIKLICQCCGMPLEDSSTSKEKDGCFNENYCKWCYADGEYMYSDMDDLISVCVKNMANEQYSEDEVRSYLKETLPKLDYWKRYKELGGNGEFEKFKKQLVDEINALNIEGMPKLTGLNALVGSYVNLEYRLPNGSMVKFLDDNTTYLGNQLECEFGGDRCFGVIANMDFIMVATYGENCTDPELVMYKKR